MEKDDFAAGAAGGVAGGGIGASVGGLGAAGLAIGGSAYAIPAVVVVAAPAVAGGLLVFGAWKGIKAIRRWRQTRGRFDIGSSKRTSERVTAGKGWTEPGSVNRHGQVNLGCTNPPRRGSNPRNWVYVMHCPVCVRNYGANGGDIHERKCPYHQGGEPGEPLQGDELDWRPE